MGLRMKHILQRCNLAKKVPLALKKGVGLVFRSLRNEVIKGKPSRESPPVIHGGIPGGPTHLRRMWASSFLPAHALKLMQPSDPSRSLHAR